MRKLLVLSVCLLLASSAVPQNTLRQAFAGSSGKVAWRIQTTPVDTCCCNERGNWTSYGDRLRVEHRELLVLATIDGNRVSKLRVVEPNCPLEGVRLLENISAEESIDFLLQHAGSDRDSQVIAVLAMHDHPRVVPELIALARRHESSDVRRHALFWLGHRAGEKAAGELLRAVDEDPEDDVREHAVFAISQLPAERAVPILIDLVKTHKRPAVRKRAMFWLAQTNDPRALELIEEILKP